MSFDRRKVRIGRVVSDKMERTVVVAVEWRQPHPIYKKAVKKRTKFKADNPDNLAKFGNTVRIIETRPLSKSKRWRVAEILTREEIAEIQPEEIGQAALEEAVGAVDDSVEVEQEAEAAPEAVTMAAALTAEAAEPEEGAETSEDSEVEESEQAVAEATEFEQATAELDESSEAEAEPIEEAEVETEDASEAEEAVEDDEEDDEERQG